MAQKKKADSLESLSYEEAYTRLQDVLIRLESGDVPLEESLQLYAQGTQLAVYCASKLEEAELTVRRWQSEGGAVEFDEWQA